MLFSTAEKRKRKLSAAGSGCSPFCLPGFPLTYCYSNYTDEAGNEVNLTALASIAHEKERQADAAGMVPAIMEIDPEQIDDYYSVCESRIVSLMQME